MTHATRLLIIVVIVVNGLMSLVWCSHPLRLDRLTPLPTHTRIDLNLADAPTLALLPGIGPTLGRRVVDHRRVAGPFERLEDLRAVQGVGPSTLKHIQPWAHCSHPAE